MQKPPSSVNKIIVFGLNITSWTQRNQFILLASGALICSLGFAYFQEKVTHIPGFSHYDFMTFLTTLTFTLCGFIERYLTNDLIRKAPMKMYFTLSFCTLGGMHLTNMSLLYLNYSTRIVFKSSKIIPVMLMGVVMQGKKYLPLEYLSVFVLVAGIVFFTLGDKSESPTFHPLGIILICGGNILDAVTANYEEKSFFHARNCSPAEVLCFASVFGAAFSFIALLLKHDADELIGFVFDVPDVAIYSIISATLGYCSSGFILGLIKTFGATNAEIVKSLRKILSVAISFTAFSKPFTSFHLYGSALFIISTFIGVHVKNEKQKIRDKEREQPLVNN